METATLEQLQASLPQGQTQQCGDQIHKKTEKTQETHGQAQERVVAGYVWKCPSEGTNEQTPTTSVVFPRRCRACQSAWVSSYEAEWKHWQTCKQHTQEVTASEKNFGIARRVWCEVDDSLTFLQVDRLRIMLSPRARSDSISLIACLVAQ